MEIFPVTPRIWCLRRRSYLTCSYLVRGAAGIVLVDAGMDSTGADVEAALWRAFGATFADVRAVLLTHWHNDHAAGAAVVRERSGAKVYYHAGDRPQLTRTVAAGGPRGWLAARVPELGPLVLLKGLLGDAIPRAVEADVLVRAGERVEEDFEVIETPGHTPGHVCYYDHRERALFAGDALATIDGRVRFMARPVTPDLASARRSMARCLDRPIAHLCPGHRHPLSLEAEARCAEMRARLGSGAAWPLLG